MADVLVKKFTNFGIDVAGVFPGSRELQTSSRKASSSSARWYDSTPGNFFYSARIFWQFVPRREPRQIDLHSCWRLRQNAVQVH